MASWQDPAYGIITGMKYQTMQNKNTFEFQLLTISGVDDNSGTSIRLSQWKSRSA